TVRGKIAILRWMPLVGDIGMGASQTVVTVHFLIGAVGTTASLASCGSLLGGSAPLMPILAEPPDRLAASVSNMSLAQGAVAGWLTLPCEIRMGRGETVGQHNLHVATARATSPPNPACDDSLPLVIVCFRAFPPGLLVAASNYIFWAQISILRRMPLGSE